MSSLRTLRPLARQIARPSYAAFSAKPSKAIAPFTPSITSQLQSRTTPAQTEGPMTKLRVLQADMPQMIPFYFVNETTFTWILLPSLIYILTKYLLPQQVRKMAGRLFISKL